MTPDLISAVKKSSLFCTLSDALCERILDGASIREVSAGETLFIQGEPARALYIIIDGWVKLYRMTPSGAEAVVSIMARGRSFGEAVALRDLPYPVSAEAITDGRLVRIEGSRLRQAITADPQLAIGIISASFVYLQQLVGQVEQLKARSGVQRVAEFLTDLAPIDSTGRCVVHLPYNKTLIAGHLGMKPESLSRAFARLRDHGVSIETTTAVIEDIGLLRDLVAEDRGKPWAK